MCMFSPQNLVFMQNMFWLKWIRDAIRKSGIIWREKIPKIMSEMMNLVSGFCDKSTKKS